LAADNGTTGGETSVGAAIVGGGFAGMTAANRLAEAGRKPVVFEAGSEPLYMCNSRVATGALHISFHSPLEPADDLYDAIIKGSDGTARPDLARAVADRAAMTIAWMRERGSEFEDHPRRMNGVPMMAPLRRMTAGLDWEESGPNLFLQMLEARLVRCGGALRRGCRAVEILRDGDGISGVVVDGPRGRETVRTRHVIVADGGFQADIDLVARHISKAAAKLMQRNTGTGRGEGLRMAAAIGAATVGLERFYGHVLSRDAMTDDRLWPYPQLDVICAKGIVVTPDGKRFDDEGCGGIYMTNAIARLGDPLSATAVFDATVWADAKDSDNVPPNPSLTDNGGTLISAGSLDDLAARAGLDAAGLKATVAAYNAAVASGRAGALSPVRTVDAYRAHPVTQAPFYAAPLCAGITVTSGGLSVDGRARVLDGAGKPIPGLYAAGSAVGGIEGGPRVGYVGGLIKAFGIGLLAADTIAEA
jgi:fumarate reductase flavoprotein subunit